MEARRYIKDLSGLRSDRLYTREQAQRLADARAKIANEKDGFRGFWKGVVFESDPELDDGYYWRIEIAGQKMDKRFVR
jgi:hypothetical protein